MDKVFFGVSLIALLVVTDVFAADALEEESISASTYPKLKESEDDTLSDQSDSTHSLNLQQLDLETLTSTQEVIRDKTRSFQERISAATHLNASLPPERREGFDPLYKFAKNTKLKNSTRLLAFQGLLRNAENLPDSKLESLTALIHRTASDQKYSPKLLCGIAAHLLLSYQPSAKELNLVSIIIEKALSKISEEGVNLSARIFVVSKLDQHVKLAEAYYEEILKSSSNELKLSAVQSLTIHYYSQFQYFKKSLYSHLLSFVENEENDIGSRSIAARCILKQNGKMIEKEKASSFIIQIIRMSKPTLSFLKSLVYFIYPRVKPIHEAISAKVAPVLKDKKAKKETKILAANHLFFMGNKVQKKEAHAWLSSFIQKTKNLESDKGKKLHKKALNTVIDCVPQEDELFQDSLNRLLALLSNKNGGETSSESDSSSDSSSDTDSSSDDNYDDALEFHKGLLKRRAEVVSHNPRPYSELGVVLNPEYITTPQETPSLPNVSYKTFKTLTRRLFKEVKENESAAKEYNSLKGQAPEEALKDAVKDPFFRGLLSKNQRTYIAPSAYKLFHILAETEKLSPECKNGLSPQSLQTLQLLLNVTECDTGKNIGIHGTSLLMHEEKGTTEDIMETERIKQRFTNLLDRESCSLRRKILNGEGELMHELTETPLDKEIIEAPHSELYLYNLLGKEVGIQFKNEIVRFDEGADDDDAFLESSKQDVLDKFYKHLSTQKYIEHFESFFNGLIAQSLNKVKGSMIVFDGLGEFLGYEALSEEKGLGFLEYDEDGVPRKITEKGTIKILLKLNHLKEVENLAHGNQNNGKQEENPSN